MQIIHELLKSNTENILPLLNQPEKNLFLNIETTGLRPSSAFIYMIGTAAITQEGLLATTYLAENKTEEQEILAHFSDDVIHSDTIITYGGNTFTFRFLKERMENYMLSEHLFSTGIHLTDLQKELVPYKEKLGLPDIKKETIEKFLHINRAEHKSGKDLIDIYEAYERSQGSPDALLLHNRQDLISLAGICEIRKYFSIFRNLPGSLHIFTEENCCHIICQTPFSLPTEVSYENNSAYIYISGNEVHLMIPLSRGSLRYFIPGNPGDYYYLPEEDCAVHKSLACYVDKAYRKKATASTLYQWKKGTFIPAYSNEYYSVFQTDYKCLPYYVEYLPEEWKKEPDKLRRFLINYF